MTTQSQLKKIEDDSASLQGMDNLINTLIIEATALFQVLDKASSQIRKVEESLSGIKAHFPFTLRVCEEENIFPNTGLGKKKIWLLSWEKDSNNDRFRLFLVTREVAIECRHYLDEDFSWVENSSEPIFKKPLIEFDLDTRMRFVKHLNAFISAFTNHIRESRKAIEAAEWLFPF